MTVTTNTLPGQHLRGGDLPQLVNILQGIDRQTVDLVLPASRLAVADTRLVLADVDPIIGDSGVTDVNGSFAFTSTAVGHIAGITDIPTRYLRRTQSLHPALFDANVNGWLTHDSLDDKNILVRLLVGLDSNNPELAGQVRALLSDRYGARDNLPFLLAALDGIRSAGLRADQLDIKGDLTEDRMYVTINAPEIQGYGWKLLEGYRSPYGNGSGTGHGGSDAENLPIISAGLLIQNSETGGSAAKITPRLVVRACSNGLQVTKDAMRQVHLGAKLAEGEVEWSAETRRAANELARTQAADAVKSFLNATYVQKVIDSLEADADTPVKEVKKTIEVVAKEQGYTEAEADSILNFFIDGGQRTAGGVLQAITAAVQQIEDPERAFDIESTAFDALKVAARVAREEVTA
jgi:hypothetical protein